MAVYYAHVVGNGAYHIPGVNMQAYTKQQAEKYFDSQYHPHRTHAVYISSNHFPGDHPARWMDAFSGEVVNATEQYTTENAPVGFPMLVKIENAQAIWEIKK